MTHFNPDINEVKRFLDAFDGAHTFQTFHDQDKDKHQDRVFFNNFMFQHLPYLAPAYSRFGTNLPSSLTRTSPRADRHRL